MTSLPRPGRRISEPCSSTTLRTPPLMSLTSNTATSSGRILWRGMVLRSMLMISPVGVTMRHESRLSSVVPYSKANGPPEFSATFPPMVEAVFEAGSTVKRNPSFRHGVDGRLRDHPASSVTLMFSRSTGDIFVNRVVRTMTERRRMGTEPPVSGRSAARDQRELQFIGQLDQFAHLFRVGGLRP